MTSFQSGTEQKKSWKSSYRKSITAILQLNLNTKFQKLKLTSLIRVFKVVTNCVLNFIRKRLINKVIIIANQNSPSMKKNIVYSQALRFNEICYHKNDLEKKLLKATEDTD